jgi:hypothetical protein
MMRSRWAILGFRQTVGPPKARSHRLVVAAARHALSPSRRPKADAPNFGRGWIVLKNPKMRVLEKQPKCLFGPVSEIKARVPTLAWPHMANPPDRAVPRVLFQEARPRPGFFGVESQNGVFLHNRWSADDRVTLRKRATRLTSLQSPRTGDATDQLSAASKHRAPRWPLA